MVKPDQLEGEDIQALNQGEDARRTINQALGQLFL